MNIQKAIEILTDCTQGALLGISEDTKDALQLGIEAMKRLRVIRGYPHNQWKQLLPGETTEEEP